MVKRIVSVTLSEKCINIVDNYRKSKQQGADLPSFSEALETLVILGSKVGGEAN
jgi:hypothetical protein